ncbi:MAG: hypothetical protein Q8S57_03345 [Methanoregula sp.]|nr:hypothetical protein [Methanoregula sp.]
MQNNEQKKNGTSVTFRTIAHFYDSDDPTPENNRELSDRAETEIFHQVLSVPKGDDKEMCNHLEIIIPASELTPDRQTAIISAIRSHFRLRAVGVQRDMKLTQKVGLREFRLTIAVCIPSFIGIAICSQFKGNPISEVLENVLVIFCWVTIWQPFQSLVFDRWTQSKTALVYRKIADMEISVRAG